MLPEITQGNDIGFEVQIFGADGLPLKPSTLENYQLYAYLMKGGKDLVLTFSKTPAAGEFQLVVTDDDAGKIMGAIPRSWTKDAGPCTVFLELRTQIDADAPYENNKLNAGQDNIAICKITESASPGSMQ